MFLSGPIEPDQPIKAFFPDDTQVRLTSTLYGVDLHAWYVIEVEGYADDEIEGTLMTCPITIYGPFATWGEARTMFTSLTDNAS